MRRRIKYLLKIMIIPTVVWFVLSLIFHFGSSGGQIEIKRLAGETIIIPL